MIIQFSVKNFKSIKDKATFSFEASKSTELEEYYVVEPIEGLRLLKLGLIYGGNASGKTTILDSLEFIRNLALGPLSDKGELLNMSPFLFREHPYDEPTEFDISFVHRKIKYSYGVTLSRATIFAEALYMYKPKKALVYKRTTQVRRQFTDIYIGSTIKMSKVQRQLLEGNTLWNNTVLGGFTKTNIDFPVLQDVVEWFRTVLSNLVWPNTKIDSFVTEMLRTSKSSRNLIVQLLKKADLGVRAIEIRSRPTIWYEPLEKALSLDEREKIPSDDKYTHEPILIHEVGDEKKRTRYPLPFEHESRGTRRYYEFAGLLTLLIKENKMLGIDEIASSLHPDLLKHFLLTFLVNSKESQIIATSHYRELLMEKDWLRKDCIWFTEKDEGGGTSLFSLDDFDSSVIRNSSSYYNAYKIGKLGATPNLGDYYISIDEDE